MTASRHCISIAIVLSSLVLLTFRGAAETALRPVTEDDARSWRQLHSYQLSPSGRWLVYAVGPVMSMPDPEGEITVVIRGVQDRSEKRYVVGAVESGAGNLQMSASGRWIAFQRASGTYTGRSGRLGLQLINLDSGTSRLFENVRNFQFTGFHNEWLLIRSYPGAVGNESTYTVTVYNLPQANRQTSEVAITLKQVIDYAMNPEGSLLAWADAKGLYVQDLNGARRHQIDAAHDSRYENLQWSKRGRALAVMRKSDGRSTYVIATALNSDSWEKVIFDSQRWGEFLAGYRLSSSLRWRADESGIFFEIESTSHTQSPENPKVGIWHWQDDSLPSEKESEVNRGHRYWCFVSLSKGRFVRLEDAKLVVEPHDSSRYVLGYQIGDHVWLNRLREAHSSSQVRDYYLVDLADGRRTQIVKDLKVVTRPGLSVEPQISPDGSFILYQDNTGDYIAYEVQSGTQRNLTTSLPVQFYFEENHPRNERQPRDSGLKSVLQGWTEDGHQVLLSDYHDVWAIPLRGGGARNLTVDGTSKGVRYSRVVLTDSYEERIFGEMRSVDLSTPIYFNTFDLNSGITGLARWTRSSGIEMLHQQYAATMYYKSKHGDIYIYHRANLTEPGDWYRLEADWQTGERLTNINPQHVEFLWPPPARYLTYKNARGQTRHAVLRLPAGYVEGNSYPTIVDIYKNLTGAVHTYFAPYTIDDAIGFFLRNGYAVLQPDIHPRVDDVGMAALEDVIAGVEAAVATGAVDRARLGLMGHSYGGYETSFIVSQTSAFRAAVVHAGVTNLWSYCNGIYINRPPLCEIDQPYLTGPWWRKWDIYLKNSPLYHAPAIETPLLLAHGTSDGPVSFLQSVELFNTLRRIGGKPIVLLEYQGEDHEFSRVAARDFYQRRLEFFDHFLKGIPAPAWWTEGTSRYEKMSPLKESGRSFR